jgi:hypothetical protein
MRGWVLALLLIMSIIVTGSLASAEDLVIDELDSDTVRVIVPNDTEAYALLILENKHTGFIQEILYQGQEFLEINASEGDNVSLSIVPPENADLYSEKEGRSLINRILTILIGPSYECRNNNGCEEGFICLDNFCILPPECKEGKFLNLDEDRNFKCTSVEEFKQNIKPTLPDPNGRVSPLGGRGNRPEFGGGQGAAGGGGFAGQGAGAGGGGAGPGPGPISVCGNWIVEPGEECDPPGYPDWGNNFMCGAGCKRYNSVCGDGICDMFDEWYTSDGCLTDCPVPVCSETDNKYNDNIEEVWERGTLTYSDRNTNLLFEDTCVEGELDHDLLEYACAGRKSYETIPFSSDVWYHHPYNNKAQIYKFEVKCPDGCENGRCKEPPRCPDGTVKEECTAKNLPDTWRYNFNKINDTLYDAYFNNIGAHVLVTYNGDIRTTKVTQGKTADSRVDRKVGWRYGNDFTLWEDGLRYSLEIYYTNSGTVPDFAELWPSKEYNLFQSIWYESYEINPEGISYCNPKTLQPENNCIKCGTCNNGGVCITDQLRSDLTNTPVGSCKLPCEGRGSPNNCLATQPDFCNATTLNIQRSCQTCGCGTNNSICLPDGSCAQKLDLPCFKCATGNFDFIVRRFVFGNPCSELGDNWVPEYNWDGLASKYIGARVEVETKDWLRENIKLGGTVGSEIANFMRKIAEWLGLGGESFVKVFGVVCKETVDVGGQQPGFSCLANSEVEAINEHIREILPVKVADQYLKNGGFAATTEYSCPATIIKDDFACRPLGTPQNTDSKLDIVFVSDIKNNDRIVQESLEMSFKLEELTPFKENKDKLNYWWIQYPDDTSPMSVAHRGVNVDGHDVLGYAGSNKVESEVQGFVLQKCPFADQIMFLSTQPFRAHARSGLGTLSLPRDSGELPETFVHEFGHSFGGLADEYVESGKRDDPRSVNCAANVQDATSIWGHLIGQGKGIEEVGFYPGCSYTPENIRPTENSLMRSHWEPGATYAAVNEEELNSKLGVFK